MAKEKKIPLAITEQDRKMFIEALDEASPMEEKFKIAWGVVISILHGGSDEFYEESKEKSKKEDKCSSCHMPPGLKEICPIKKMKDARKGK